MAGTWHEVALDLVTAMLTKKFELPYCLHTLGQTPGSPSFLMGVLVYVLVYVFDGCPGVFLVETGGNVNVDGTLKLWSGGSVDMMSGSLEVGTLDIREGLFDMDGGTLKTADVLGDLRIQGGTFRPGHSPAVTTITGHYTQDADGILEIELAGFEEGKFDLLNISGYADLGGTLEVTLLDDYLPKEGDLFTFLTAATIRDTFDYLILPDLAGQTEWKLIYGSDSVSLGVVSAVPLPAAVWLFGTGLLSLIGFSKRKKAA